ncbi:hypothetical protein NW752_010247 [Fusarium irregulare]|uniref:Uncharacterized protein n=1 Tax=Fusarium irregulare TaxID=2494466 RepID=A0A9W8PJ91_9HYPO|nr:hypothetical protein NW752_010247 [Fusarium irregulare]KAJ4007885.1 hypothetical protein NW766_009696 [Fusarium irregulare]
MAARTSLQDAKGMLLEAGKEAQKFKEKAKTDFENDDYKPDDLDISTWTIQNCTQLNVYYSAYAAAAAIYIAALEQVDPSAAKERQKVERDYKSSLRKAGQGNSFEEQYYIDLPEE